MKKTAQTAQDRFAGGYNCSQSVFSALASQLGIDDETALKLASPFGGGVAHQGDVCGAVTGALMALGLARGSASSDKEKKDETYRLAEDFIKRFRELHGSSLCRELIGYNISNPDEFQKARDNKVFYEVCPRLVKDATQLVAEYLEN